MKAAAAIAALLCVVPVGTSASFTATALDVDWNTFRGDASAFLFVSPVPDDAFDLRADSLAIEAEWMRMVVAGEAGHVTEPPTTETSNHGPSSWTARSRAAGASILLVPRDAVISAGQGTGIVALPAVDCLPQPTYFVGARPTACPDTGASLRMQGQATQWLVEGNFSVVLWAWEGTGTTAEGGATFWTGTRATQANVAGLGEVELRQSFLHVVNGSLRLNLPDGAVLDAYATTMDLATDMVAPLGNPAGENAIVATTSDGHLKLHRGEPQTVQATPAERSASWAGWQVGALGASLVLIPIGLAYTRRQGAFAHLRLANRNMEIDNHLAAARHAAKATRARELKVEANVLGAIAAMEGHDFEGAQRFLHDLHKQRFHDEAACRYLLAHMRIKQGRNEEGQRLVEECLVLDPSYDEEVAANPVLAPFLDPSKWPRTVE